MSAEKSQAEPSSARPRTFSAPEEHPDEAPPSYSGPLDSAIPSPPTPSARRDRLEWTPGIIPLDYGQYLPPGSELANDQTTITLASSELLSNPIALTKFVTSQLKLPPRPQIRITGSHDQGGGRKVDFDIRLNMQRYIVQPTTGLNYVSIDPIEISKKTKLPPGVSQDSSEASIAAWATRFCKDRRDNKSFTIHRKVSNWNTSLLDGRLRSLIASLRYHGRITISFPTTHATITIQPPSTFFSRLGSLFKEAAHYETIRGVWPYADVSDGQSPRTCAVQTEEVWFISWRNAITRAILTGRIGWVSLDDLMDDAMLPLVARPNVDWGGNPW